MLTFSRQNLRKNIWLQFITNPLFEGKEETNFLAVSLSILSIDVEKKFFESVAKQNISKTRKSS